MTGAISATVLGSTVGMPRYMAVSFGGLFKRKALAVVSQHDCDHLRILVPTVRATEISNDGHLLTAI